MDKSALLITVNILIPDTDAELQNGEERDFEDALALSLLENDITASVEIVNQEVV